MFFGLQPIHIVFIFIVALLVFGPKKLPEMGRTIGKALNEFRNGTREITDSLRAEVSSSAEPITAQDQAPAKPAVPPLGSVPFQDNSIRPAQTIAPPKSGNFCIQCGAPNPFEAHFCNHCGQPLPENRLKPATPSS
jgi:sec-independent protein translocase protein TatA